MTAQCSTAALKVSVAVIMLFQVSALFVRELVRLELTQAGTPPGIARYQSAWVGFLVLVILMWPYWRQHRFLLASEFRRPDSWLGLVLASVAIGVSTRISSWGVTFVNASLPANSVQGDWTAGDTSLTWLCFDGGPLLLAVVTMALATPAIEEVVNRSYILGALVRKGIGFPVLCSAGLFAVLHRPDGMLVAFLFGIAVAVQKMHCRTLWGPVIAHGTFNTLYILDAHCLRYPAVESVLLTLPAFGLGSLGVGIGVAAFLLAVKIARWGGAAAP